MFKKPETETEKTVVFLFALFLDKFTQFLTDHLFTKTFKKIYFFVTLSLILTNVNIVN